MSNIASLKIGDNTLEVPGKYVEKFLEIVKDEVITSVKTVDLSSYLPNDGYVYEVKVNGWVDNRTRVGITTDKMPNVWLTILYSNSSYASIGGSTETIVGKGRYIQFHSASDQTGRIGSVELKGYRRLYKDE